LSDSTNGLRRHRFLWYPSCERDKQRPARTSKTKNEHALYYLEAAVCYCGFGHGITDAGKPPEKGFFLSDHGAQPWFCMLFKTLKKQQS
jgi:hypothetical protein